MMSSIVLTPKRHLICLRGNTSFEP